MPFTKKAIALITLTLTTGMLVSGCICCPMIPDDIIVPSTSPTTTPNPSPSLNPLQMQYNFVEHLNLGKSSHNTGIDRMMQSNNAFNRTNMSEAKLMLNEAQASMQAAMNEYNESLQYAIIPGWSDVAIAYRNVSWAYYMSFDYLRLAYDEWEYQTGRSAPNYILYTSYINEANRYMHMTGQFSGEAKALENAANIYG